MINHFQDKVAIVTGGASGIGRALCEELGTRETIVIIADMSSEEAQQVESGITASGGRGHAVYLDVSQAADIQRVIDETVTEYGRLDYMFNNAGIGVRGEVRDMTLEHWRQVIDTNLFGVLYGTTSAYSCMVKQGFGHIINTASLAGLIGYPLGIPYATSKHAVVGFSTSLRIEAADLGVKVSVVCPGYVKTNIWDAAPVVRADKEAVAAIRLPFKMINASDAARMILRGVVRNQGIIIFPFHARLLWRLYRFFPAILTPLGYRMVKSFRSIRTQSDCTS